MNNTAINDEPIGFQYSTIILGTLLVVSEILPLIKSRQNGMLHTLLCFINGSKCILGNVEKAIEKKLEIEKKVEDIKV